MAKKILCLCDLGRNRSRFLAAYLKQKGFQTRYGGLRVGPKDLLKPNQLSQYAKPTTKKDIDWADLIIIARKGLKSELIKKYQPTQKIILLQVSDDQKYIGRKYPKFKKISYVRFQKLWVEPQLKKAIAGYLRTLKMM